jgi:hypothetical protein
MTIDHGKELTTHKVTGVVFYEEIINALKHFWEDQPTKNLMWDCTRANMTHLFYSEAKKIIDYDIPQIDKRSGGKTALVGLRDLEFGMLRTLKALRELQNPSYQIEVFRSLEEANEWLAEG